MTNNKKNSPNQTPPPHYHGHRARLRKKFIDGGNNTLADYELLELILFASTPRADVKPLAKRLIANFKGLDKVISADVDALQKTEGIGDAAIAAIKAVEAAAEHMLRSKASKLPIINSWTSLLDYLRISLGNKKIEHFRVLFLDRKHKLLADEIQNKGTIDHTPVYPREIVKKALDLHASAIILVHNHPSGDPTPSQQDIDLTEDIATACVSLDISLHDHIIIAKDEHFSFKSHGLL